MNGLHTPRNKNHMQYIRFGFVNKASVRKRSNCITKINRSTGFIANQRAFLLKYYFDMTRYSLIRWLVWNTRLGPVCIFVIVTLYGGMYEIDDL